MGCRCALTAKLPLTANLAIWKSRFHPLEPAPTMPRNHVADRPRQVSRLLRCKITTYYADYVYDNSAALMTTPITKPLHRPGPRLFLCRRLRQRSAVLLRPGTPSHDLGKGK